MTDSVSANQSIAKPVIRSEAGMVASQHSGAARIGADILASGGNAIDAAIAVSFALGVLEPWMSGIGGGGQMVIHPADGETRVIDFSLASPAGLDPADYPIVAGNSAGGYGWRAVKDRRNEIGATAIAIPGIVAGMGLAHEHYGNRPWAELLAPAIALARRGLAVDWYATLMIGQAARNIAQFPDCAAVFLPEGWPPMMPTTPDQQVFLPMHRLANTLEILRDGGPEAFYAGPLAETIAGEVQKAGGCLTSADLADYRALLLDPLEISHGGATIWASPGLTGGPAVQGALERMADTFQPSEQPDADFFLATARALRDMFTERLATAGPDGCTTHFTVIDRDGMMVAVTQTIVSVFGSQALLPQTGILMNNAISWFDPEPGRPNSLVAGKRGLNNMCPIIGMRSDGTLFGLGASGGRRIVAAVVQAAAWLTDYGMDIEEALHQPRIDVSGTDTLLADHRLDAAIIERLETEFVVVRKKPVVYPFWFANVTAASRRDGVNTGGTEPMLPWADACTEGE